MLGSGAILGAPSLPKFTTRRTAADPEPAATLPRSRRAASPAEPRTRPPAPESLRLSPPRTRPEVRSPRQAPVAVAGKAPSAVSGRPAATFQRILEAVPLLRPEKITRLLLDLGPGFRIELSSRRGAVDGLVHAANDAARARIESHLDRLRTMLEGKGIKVGSLRVLVADSSSSELVSLVSSPRVHRVDLLA